VWQFVIFVACRRIKPGIDTAGQLSHPDKSGLKRRKHRQQQGLGVHGLVGRTPCWGLPDSPRHYALDPGFHCVGTHWIQGFIAFRLAPRTVGVMLMVSA
jgi:hypothetical protein